MSDLRKVDILIVALIIVVLIFVYKKNEHYTFEGLLNRRCGNKTGQDQQDCINRRTQELINHGYYPSTSTSTFK